MASLTTKEIIEATGGELLSDLSEKSENSIPFEGVSIDSRTISGKEIFFALRGERFDGHNFLNAALSKGAGAVIDSKPDTIPKGKAVIYVRDTLRALQDVAHFIRVKRNIPVVAITGSNGKTTTKEMTYMMLSRRFSVLKNEGNLNNHIGLPLSITRLAPSDEVVVLELGMSGLGEIRRLCEIAVPTHGMITNIGVAHIGKLGSLASIRSAKLEILHGLAVAVLNADDSFLMEGVKGFEGKVITFSINNDSHVKAERVLTTDSGSNFTLCLKGGESVEITLNIHGLFNVYNALAASAVCISLGITLDEIKTALKSYAGVPMRFQTVKANAITIINDSYNANPSSMAESLNEFVRVKDGMRAVVILGDMLELGEFSEEAHKSIGKIISEMDIDVFVAVGEMMALAAEESRKNKAKKQIPIVYVFKNAGEAGGDIMNILRQGDAVLVKGSRAMGMEKIIERIGDK
jgi:UDP-N-acetylmuramoyl-tripeptide--D-alanyl-D-alanine ligase